MAEIKGANTRPAPIPMRIDATNIRTDVLRNMNPTPRPISVVPPMTHALLSSFMHFNLVSFSLFTIIISNTDTLRITTVQARL